MILIIGSGDGSWIRSRYDGLGILIFGEASYSPALETKMRAAAVILHINDSCPGNGQLRSADLCACNCDFRASVHNSDWGAKHSSCVENQGGKEKSRG
jgi:hypothetical protein